MFTRFLILLMSAVIGSFYISFAQTNAGNISLPDKARLHWQQHEQIMFVCPDPSTWQGREYDNQFNTCKLAVKLKSFPKAPGAYRSDLTAATTPGDALKWGISMVHNGNECFLIRYKVISR